VSHRHQIAVYFTYHSRFIPKGIAEVSQIFLRDTHVLPKLLAMRNTAEVTGGKPIAVLLQSISDVSAINALVAFIDIHGGKREVLFFYFVPDTTRDCSISGVTAVNPIIAFYDIHGKKRQVLFYSSVPNTTRQINR
jgi:hypothetical protein